MDSTIESLRIRLAQHKGRWPELSVLSGVPISTLRKVAQGHIQNPRIGTVDKLHKGLEEIPPQ